jgi:hypothetical protein
MVLIYEVHTSDNALKLVRTLSVYQGIKSSVAGLQDNQ